MSSQNLAFVAGIAGFFLGGFAVYQATVAADVVQDVRETQIEDDETLGAFAERITALEADARAQNGRIGGIQSDERQLREKVKEILAEFEAFKAWAKERDTAGQLRLPDGGSVGVVDIGVAKMRARYDELRPRVWAGEATADEEAEFWKIARTTGALDEVMEELGAKVAAAPRDIDLRMQLANAYTAKLLSVPDGPERGAWASKAEAEWGSILEVDEEHWQARYNRAFSWSQWPPFLGKAPAAIKEFETLREKQERLTPEPRHAQVYLDLVNLYRGQGNVDRAAEVLRAGVERHPESKMLKDALDASSR